MKSKYVPAVHFSLKAETAGHVLQNFKYHPAGCESAASLFFSETEDLQRGYFFVEWRAFSLSLSACTPESCSLLWPSEIYGTVYELHCA